MKIKKHKDESFAKDYTDTVILFNGDSILIVDDWKSLRSLGPSTYKRDVKIVTTFVEEMREFVPYLARLVMTLI